MIEMNKKYLNHNNVTDILTFDYSNSNFLEAEIFISYSEVVKSATTHHQTTLNELLRVFSHGVLHCMGYNDQSPLQIKSIRVKEDEFISLFHVKHPTHV
jgi:probable rRNA maturation factor